MKNVIEGGASGTRDWAPIHCQSRGMGVACFRPYKSISHFGVRADMRIKPGQARTRELARPTCHTGNEGNVREFERLQGI